LFIKKSLCYIWLLFNENLTVAYREKLLLEKTLRFFNSKLKEIFMATTNQIPDALLVKSYIAGDENAIGLLINRHQSKIYGFIYSKLADRDIADDIFQDTFIKVIKNLKSNTYNEEGKFLTWVMRISHNLIVDHYRKNKKMPMLRETEEFSIFSILKDSSQNIEGKIITEIIEKDLQKLVNELPKDQKEVLIMRIYQDLSFNEIAELTGVSINTALGRMRYALLNLRKVIEKNKIILTN